MKKLTQYSLLASLLSVGASQAATVALDLPATGNHIGATVITTAATAGTATFDINYTIDSISNGDIPFAHVNGAGSLGVGSIASDPPGGGTSDSTLHYATLEGNDNEGLSFTSLTISNFVANDSGFFLVDITNLRFTGLTFNNTGNNNDGINLSSVGFADGATGDNFDMNPLPTGPATASLDLDAGGDFTNYGLAERTTLYIEPDGNQTSNRWGISGIEVQYTIPEPTSFALLGLGGLGLILRRRR